MMLGIPQSIIMTEIVIDNKDLKLIENERAYVLYAKDMRVVFNEECEIDRIYVLKEEKNEQRDV